jgi:hypothetical protein
MGVFNPVFAAYRLHPTAAGRVTCTLSSSSATIAALTALWGLLASVTSPRAAIAIAGLLLLATPLLLPAMTGRPSPPGTGPRPGRAEPGGSKLGQ